MKTSPDTLRATQNSRLLLGATTMVAVAGLGGWAVTLLDRELGLTAPAPTVGPFVWVGQLIRDPHRWQSANTVTAAVIAGLLVVPLAMWWAFRSRRPAPGVPVKYAARAKLTERYPDDRATAPHMPAHIQRIAHLTPAGSAKTNRRFGMTGPGLQLGRAVRNGTVLHTTWEDTVVVVSGPRTSKTTSYAVPAVLAAPGACLATSNKRDLVDLTGTLRAELGTVWTFDPMAIATDGAAVWSWDPLSYVVDEATADKLAAQLFAATRSGSGSSNEFFDTAAVDLISLFLLAAARNGQPVTQVFRWLSDSSTAHDPGAILTAAGFELRGGLATSRALLPERHREGIFDTARLAMSWLSSTRIEPWVVPHGNRPTFDPHAFAGSTDTLYALSQDGTASVGPLVAALTMAVLDALDDLGKGQRDGRLPVPAVLVLDECANICRIKGLDSYYSHFGSRGIVLFSILQSWAQGEDAWGEKGMAKLFSAANHRIYGGGVSDPTYLKMLSEEIGTTRIRETSTSTGGNGGNLYGSGRQTSHSYADRQVMPVSELGSLPKGRAILTSSGAPAVLLEPVPWWRGPRAFDVTRVAEERKAGR